MTTTNLEVVISAQDHFTATANRVAGSLRNIENSARRVGTGVGQVAGGLARLGVVAAGAAAGGIIAVAKAAATFEAQLNTINTIARATPAQLTGIGDGIRQLAREGRGDLADLSAGFYDILSAGITDTAKAQKVLEAATSLAIGGLSTNAEAVDLLTTAINAYGQDASAATADADMFAKSIELGKVKASEIAASLANVAPVAAQNGVQLREIAAAYATLTAQGTPAAEVTTQMARAIVELIKPKKELEDFQDLVGHDFAADMRENGLVATLQNMRELADKNGVPFQDLFGRIEAYKFALQTTGPQNHLFNEALDAMGNSAGTAAEQMGERTHGLAFTFARLKANVKDAAISIGTGLTPALSRMADKLSDFLQANRADLESFGRDIGSALDGIDFDALLATIKDLGSAFKNDVLPFLRLIVDLVGKLPAPITAAAGALAIAGNTPLVGGALTSIGRGIGNIAVGAAGMAASAGGRAGALGRLFAQPVFVTNWPMGGIGGGGGTGGGGAGAGLGLIGGAFALAAVGAIEVAIAEPLGQWMRAQPWWNTDAGPVHIGGPSQSEQAHPVVPPAAVNRIAGATSGIASQNLSHAAFEASVKAYPSPALVAAITAKNERIYAGLEANRAATDRTTSASNRVYNAVEESRNQRPPIVNVDVDVSVKTINSKTTVTRNIGETGTSGTGRRSGV